MSTVNLVRFYVLKTSRFEAVDLERLISLAYLAARDRKLYPQEILIRTGIHNTTKIDDQYQQDPGGPHATLCYKDVEQVARGTHVASHSYVKSMQDWTFVNATHRPEKPDGVRRAHATNAVWPGPERLREVSTIAYSHLAGCMEDWAQDAQHSPANLGYGATDDGPVPVPTPAAGESRQAAEEQDGGKLFVDTESDTYAEVIGVEALTFKLQLLDGSTVRTQSTGWEEALVFCNDWEACYSYLSKKTGTRYWTWSLQPDQGGKGKAKRKGKGR